MSDLRVVVATAGGLVNLVLAIGDAVVGNYGWAALWLCFSIAFAFSARFT